MTNPYANFLRRCYTIIFYLITPIILLRLLWRSFSNSDYRKRWNERFAWIEPSTNPLGTIWIHAVSVGETIAALPLVNSLKEKFPHHEIMVTTTTPTGSRQVKKLLGNTVRHVYAPYDMPHVVKRFLKRTRTVFCIIMETELWPNILYQCHKYKIPLMLANGRLSNRSYRRYQLIKNLIQSMLNYYQVVAAQSKIDADNFLSLGLNPKKLLLSGNIKFDIEISSQLKIDGEMLRQQLGKNRSVLVAASTHAGEEEIILDAFSIILKKLPTALLILVPRHPERFERVKKLCLARNYTLKQRSLNDKLTEETQILLGDTMGELKLFYAAADCAFVGGSLVPVGGHNLIEPAALGLPVLTGAHLQNFTEISQLLLNAKGAEIVEDASSLAKQSLKFLTDNEIRKRIGHNAWQVTEMNRGALAKHVEWIQHHIIF